MTLFEILERVKENKTVPYGDLRLAVLVLDSLITSDHADLRRIVDHPLIADMVRGDSFRRTKTALDSEPLEWLGPDNLPESEQYQKRRRIALGILKRVRVKGGKTVSAHCSNCAERDRIKASNFAISRESLKRRKNWLRASAKQMKAYCAKCRKILFDCSCYRPPDDLYRWLKGFLENLPRDRANE